MAAQALTWPATSFGGFSDATLWLPREAPTPNIGQTLSILGGSMAITAEPLDDYTFNLLPSGSETGLVWTNQVFDAETLVRQTAQRSFIGTTGNVANFGEMHFGATGVPTTTTLSLSPGSVFRNIGVFEVSGVLETIGGGFFVNNGTVSVDGGVLVISNIAPELARSSFIIEDGGTLELNGITNSTISFAAGTNGRLLFDQPGAANSVGAIRGFDRGDEIVIVGSVASANYVGDGSGGTLFLANALGAEIGRIPFGGAYTTANFTFAAAPDGKTAIGSSLGPPPPLPPGSAVVARTDAVLDLDDYSQRAATFTMNGPNDITFTLPRGLTVRDTALWRADFLDGSLVFDIASPGGRYVPNEDASGVARLYYTVLGRGPEFAGEKYWVGIMDTQNLSLQALAPFFYNSPEFQARYGTNTTNSQFIDLLYRNILGRAGEDEGVAYWQGQLGSGVTRDVVVYAFSESIEHQAIRYDVIKRNGIVFVGDAFL
jgi:Domain of unknown function (DUF4214)